MKVDFVVELVGAGMETGAVKSYEFSVMVKYINYLV